MTMDKFYAFCGLMLDSFCVESGEFPSKTFTQCWTYENGEASFDGKKWRFFLGKPQFA